MNGTPAGATGVDRLEYRFAGTTPNIGFLSSPAARDAAPGEVLAVLQDLDGIVGSIYVLSLVRPRTELGPATLWPLAAVLFWIGLDRWGLPIGAPARTRAITRRAFRTIRCESSIGKGLPPPARPRAPRCVGRGRARAGNTEFFLFFTTPRCAIQLPSGRWATCRSCARGWIERRASTARGQCVSRERANERTGDVRRRAQRAAPNRTVRSTASTQPLVVRLVEHLRQVDLDADAVSEEVSVDVLLPHRTTFDLRDSARTIAIAPRCGKLTSACSMGSAAAWPSSGRGIAPSSRTRDCARERPRR